MLERAGAAFLEAIAWRHLVVRLAGAELRRDQARLALGSIWWILDALLYLAVYTLLIVVIVRRGGPDYPLFIFGPLLAWKWLALSLGTACAAVVANERIVRQLVFPRITLPLARLTVQLWRYLGGVVVLLVLMVVFWPERVTPALGWLPVLMVAQLVLVLPFAVILAAVGVAFRDVATVVRHAMRIGLYLSPVLFSLDQAVSNLPPSVAAAYAVNPIALLIEGYRAVTWAAVPPPPASILLPLGVGLVLLGPALAIFKRSEPGFPKRL